MHLARHWLRVIAALWAAGCMSGVSLAASDVRPGDAPVARVASVGQSISSPRAKVTLLAEHAQVSLGRTLWLGLHFQLTPGWHVYWLNPGDSGSPPGLTWRLPEGVEVGPIEWPAPKRIPVGPLVNFGYEGEVLLAVPVKVPAAYGGRSLPVELSAEWLVCEVSCIPEEGRFTLDLAVDASGGGALSGDAPRFVQQRRQVPGAAPPEGWRVGARVADGRVAVQIDAPSQAAKLRDLFFFPYAEGLMQASASQSFKVREGGYALTLSGSDSPVGDWSKLAGVIVGQAVDQAAPHVAFAVEAPIVGYRAGAIRPAKPVADEQVAQSATQVPLSFWLALGLAFVGGVLLNLMPCVFPVLSIKLLTLMRSAPEDGVGAAARQARLSHAGGYSAGVIVSFMALAGALLALRSAGETLGWGFQLQSPMFVAGMAILFFAFGLSMSGALPIATLAEDIPGGWRLQRPLVDAFCSGVLAVLVASPCTAPFMGAALGAAFLMSPAETLAVFFALGTGMALPYALLSAWPGALSCLPRPGAWMIRVKELLAFPMYATVVWLAWVLVEQVGADGIVPLGAALMGVGGVAWVLGWAGARIGLAAILSAVGLIGTLLIQIEAIEPVSRAPAADAKQASQWGGWSAAEVALAHAAGQTVFVDFTAAWCITCQVNKRLVLNREATQSAFAQAGVRTLRADWTLKDPVITAELARLGRNGVPVYALYPPHGAPVLLPEVLTLDSVREALAGVSAPRQPAGPAK